MSPRTFVTCALVAVLLLLQAHEARVEANVSFSASFAEINLNYSYAAYCSNVLNWKCEYCTASFQVVAGVSDSNDNTFGYVGYTRTSPPVGYVVFRGTQISSIDNWIEDLDFGLTSYPAGGKVHEGFYGDWQDLKPSVQTAIQQLQRDVPGLSEICYTGHSLGAAIATLAIIETLPGGINGILVTFGSPRVGNQAFATYANNKIGDYNTIRVVNHKDIVPHLPPEDFYFCHINEEVYYSNPTSYQLCEIFTEEAGEDDNCSDQFWDPDSISDHLDYLGLSLNSAC